MALFNYTGTQNEKGLLYNAPYEQEIVANLERATQSVQAAKELINTGYYDFAASRAYYAVVTTKPLLRLRSAQVWNFTTKTPRHVLSNVEGAQRKARESSRSLRLCGK